MPQSNRLKFFGSLFVAVLGASLIFLASIINAPDFSVQFTREVPSKVALPTLSQALDSLQQWPQWFYGLLKVERVNSETELSKAADQKLAAGATLRLYIEPKKKEWKRFQMTARVLEYIPGRMLRIQILSDSKQKLTSMFDDLEWTVELSPSANAPALSVIKGGASALTKQWRSRLFGRLTPKILMNQAFYPNLIALAELTPQNVSERKAEAMSPTSW